MVIKFDRYFPPAGENRGIHLYLPDDYYESQERYPVLYMFDGHKPNQLKKTLPENVKVTYLETPSNPMMHVTDIRACAELAHSRGAILAVDNTFLSPYWQNPIALGADPVLHSGTESLITYPAVQTHPDVPQEVRERLGITDTLLRLSVGLEHVDDLIADLQQAMEE